LLADCLLGQLGKVFDQLDMYSVGFDWAILTAAIETLEHFMSLVEKAMDEQYSNDSSVLDQDHLEEAVLVSELSSLPQSLAYVVAVP